MLCILFYYYCGVNLVNNMLCHWRMFMSISIMRIFLLLFVQLICCQNIDVVIENHENILLQSIQWLHMIEIDAAQLWKWLSRLFFHSFSWQLSSRIALEKHAWKLLPIRQRLQYFLCVNWHTLFFSLQPPLVVCLLISYSKYGRKKGYITRCWLLS